MPLINRILSVALCVSMVTCLGNFQTIAFAENGAASTAPSIPKDTSAAYDRIRGWIGKNPAAGMTAWGMSYDHLFLNYQYGDIEKDDCLRELCKRFVRLPGGIDLLFAKVIDEKTSEEDLVAITQILIFFAWDDQPHDDRIKSELSDAVLEAIRKGRLDNASRKYPDLSLSHHLQLAAQKARPPDNRRIPQSNPAPP